MNEYDKTLPAADEFKDTSKRFVWMLALLGVVVLTGIFTGRPVYRFIKAQRALSMLPQAEEDLRSGNADRLSEAGRIVRTVVGLAPTEPKVLRLVANYCSKVGSAEALNYWQLLVATPEATREDHLGYLDACAAFNRSDLAGPHLQGLLKTAPTDPDYIRFHVRWVRNTGSLAEAIAAARGWVRIRPEDQEAQFALGSFLSGAVSAEERAEGRRILWGFAVGQGTFRDASIDVLASGADPGRELSDAECRILLKSLAGRTDRRTTILGLRSRLEPERRAELVAELAKAALADGSLPALAEAAAWFADHGDLLRVLEMLPTEKIGKQTALVTARLQALMELGRLDEVQPYLDMTEPPVEAYMLHCLRASAALKGPRPQLVLGHFENAIAACSNQPSRLQFVAGYAERVGQPRAAIAAHESLMRWPQLTQPSGREILRLVKPLYDTRLVAGTLRRLSQAMPSDDSLFAGDTYYGLLVGEPRPEAPARLSRLMAADPKDFTFPFLLALGELRHGDPTKALALMEGSEVDWTKAEPRVKAVYVAALGAGNQREAARQMARRIDLAALTAEERQLIKEWL